MLFAQGAGTYPSVTRGTSPLGYQCTARCGHAEAEGGPKPAQLAVVRPTSKLAVRNARRAVADEHLQTFLDSPLEFKLGLAILDQ